MHMPTSASSCDFGREAADFRLPATDGRSYTLQDLRGPSGLLIVFICNHCPYVKAITGRLVRDAVELAGLGVGTAAISSNDAESYPEDSFENMKLFAAERGFPFPYLYDESQDVARAYGAICTPDFFGFDAGLKLQYRGRLDASGKNAVPDARRELFEAMREIARTGKGPIEQVAAIGCSIKWRQ
jgi:peroxiredoxin